MNLCQYRNALGVPHHGVHQRRMIGNLAANDVGMTILGSLLLSFLFFSPFRHLGNFIKIFLIILGTMMGLAILLHRLFCVRTTIDIWLFPVV